QYNTQYVTDLTRCTQICSKKPSIILDIQTTRPPPSDQQAPSKPTHEEVPFSQARNSPLPRPDTSNWTVVSAPPPRAVDPVKRCVSRGRNSTGICASQYPSADVPKSVPGVRRYRPRTYTQFPTRWMAGFVPCCAHSYRAGLRSMAPSSHSPSVGMTRHPLPVCTSVWLVSDRWTNRGFSRVGLIAEAIPSASTRSDTGTMPVTDSASSFMSLCGQNGSC